MTAQASDFLEYKGKRFSLNDIYPLDNKLKGVIIQGKTSSTACRRGYVANWKIENNKFYLVSINSDDLKLESLFGSSNIQFANWFSGSIEIGFGNYYCLYSLEVIRFYDNYFRIKIENGIVIERKIIKKPLHTSILNIPYFNKSFVSFSSIVHGCYNDSLKINYIKSLVDHFTNQKKINSILIPYFEFTSLELEILKQIEKYKFETFITNKCIAFNCKSQFEHPDFDSEYTEGFSLLIEKILSSDFSKSLLLTKSGFDKSKILQDSLLLLNPNKKFIDWILSDGSIFINHLSLINSRTNSPYKVKKLKSFKINRINSYSFEYEPLFEEISIIDSDISISSYLNKLEEKYFITYDSSKEYFTYSLFDDDILEKLGFYKYESREIEHGTQYLETFLHYDKYKEKYLQSEENYSDEFIDIFLDGDSDAFIKIDELK